MEYTTTSFSSFSFIAILLPRNQLIPKMGGSHNSKCTLYYLPIRTWKRQNALTVNALPNERDDLAFVFHLVQCVWCIQKPFLLAKMSSFALLQRDHGQKQQWGSDCVRMGWFYSCHERLCVYCCERWRGIRSDPVWLRWGWFGITFVFMCSWNSFKEDSARKCCMRPRNRIHSLFH